MSDVVTSPGRGVLAAGVAGAAGAEPGCPREPYSSVGMSGVWKLAAGEARSHVVGCNYSAVSRRERLGICGEYSSALA